MIENKDSSGLVSPAGDTMPIDLNHCSECSKEINLSNQSEIGFTCETFSVCVECDKSISEDWEEFQIVMKPEIEYLEKHSPFCKMMREDSEVK